MGPQENLEFLYSLELPSLPTGLTTEPPHHSFLKLSKKCVTVTHEGKTTHPPEPIGACPSTASEPLRHSEKAWGSPCRGPSRFTVSDRLGVKRHTACWKAGQLCSTRAWQYSMTLAQIYAGEAAVTHRLAPRMSSCGDPGVKESKVMIDL